MIPRRQRDRRERYVPIRDQGAADEASRYDCDRRDEERSHGDLLGGGVVELAGSLRERTEHLSGPNVTKKIVRISAGPIIVTVPGDIEALRSRLLARSQRQR